MLNYLGVKTEQIPKELKRIQVVKESDEYSGGFVRKNIDFLDESYNGEILDMENIIWEKSININGHSDDNWTKFKELINQNLDKVKNKFIYLDFLQSADLSEKKSVIFKLNFQNMFLLFLVIM